MDSTGNLKKSKYFETLIYHVPEPGIGHMILNRPEYLNALSLAMVEELHELFDELIRSEEIRVLIISGAGRGFCAGADLGKPELLKPAIHEGAAGHLKAIQRRYSSLIIKLRGLPQPVIAVVSGPAAGGGMCLALSADIVYVSPTATFINSFINIGLSGGELGSSYLLPRLTGFSRAAEILYTGRTVDAREAERIGLVTRLVEDESKLIESAMDTARVMLKKNPMGLRLTKEALNRNLSAVSLKAAIEIEDLNQSICITMPEIQQAVKKFMKDK
jgi:enoyl-CoA hydratase